MENGGTKTTEINLKTHNANNKKRSKPNIISKLFFYWMCPVIFNGNRRDVEEDDLVIPGKTYDSERQGDLFEKYWLEEYESSTRENREPSLWKALRRAYWLSYMPGAFFVLVTSAARTVQPLLFAQLLSFWSVNSEMEAIEAGAYALAMLGINFLVLMCQHHNSIFVARFSLKVKVGVSALLYRKLLRMSQVSLGDVAAGKLVNLLSNDVARFDYAFMFLHHIWIIPIQAAVVLYFMYDAAGYAPFVGLGIVLIMVLPLQVGLTKLTSVVRRQTAQRTDKRIKLMSEIINGIQVCLMFYCYTSGIVSASARCYFSMFLGGVKNSILYREEERKEEERKKAEKEKVIKMYAWEKPFQLVVNATRAYEMNALKKSMAIRSLFLGFMMFTERSILFFTTLTLILTGTMVTATTIYPIQQYFGIIQINLTMIFPIAIASFSEMMVSIERVQGFLELDERDDLQILPTTKGPVNKVTFNSNKEAQEEAATNVTPKKYMQNNLLRTDLSTEFTQAPRKSIGGDYAIELVNASASWTKTNKPSEMTLKNVSMRMRRGKLCAIIGPVGSGKSSLLQLLLKELPLSSGNVNIKGKISYASQESWLFPGTVRENILFGLPYDIQKYKEVCRICSLAPDFKQFPYGDLSLVGDRGVSLSGGQRARINLARAVYREADVYLLDDPLSAVDANVGRQLFEGCINGYLRGKTCILVTHQIHFLKAADYIVVLNNGTIENMGTYDELLKSEQEFSMLLSNLDEKVAGDDKLEKKIRSLQRGISERSEENPEDEKEQIQDAEERAKGSLKWSVLLQYFKSVQSWCLVFMTLLALIIVQAAGTSSDYWLSFWTNQIADHQATLPEGEEIDTGLGAQIGLLTTGQYIGIYGGLVISVIVFLLIRIAIFVATTMRASQNLHNSVFKNLIASVMRFFDTNPSGRVLNRFSKDMGAIDEMLPRSFLETIQMYLAMSSILVLNAIALVWTLIPTAILVVIFVVLLKWYLNAAQAVKRLEGTTKSPVFGMMNSTISGLSTIRSSNSQRQLLRSFDKAQDLHTSAFYTYVGGTAAFGLYLDALCLIYLAIIMYIFIFIDFGDAIPVGSVGLAVSQSMMLTMLLQMAARYTADFLAQTTSLERVLEYTKLPAEKNIDFGPTQPPKGWPAKGNIKFERVFMKYGPSDPPVLKNLNFEVHSGWKVGVVGRTGAGKSSLISALFRLSDIEGSIKVDEIDTDGIAKQELRSQISIIPQEPVLFSATVRYNLDPFNHYGDDDIWRALEQVELKESIPALDFKVSEGGSNFSVGQRQLMCLARAVLRSNKILIMDEATANVDPQTDALIQKTIRRAFTSCTVVTIAHRLNTIMDSDRVLVMDKGEVAEFDHPYLLLKDSGSKLTFMVNETGENMAKQLFEMAKTKYFSDNPEKLL